MRCHTVSAYALAKNYSSGIFLVLMAWLSSSCSAFRDGYGVSHYHSDIELQIGEVYVFPAKHVMAIPDINLTPTKCDLEGQRCLFRSECGTVQNEAWIFLGKPFSGLPYLESYRLKLQTITATGVTIRTYGAR